VNSVVNSGLRLRPGLKHLVLLAGLGGLLTGVGPVRSQETSAGSQETSAGAAVDPSSGERARLVEGYNRWAAGLRDLRAGGKARVGAEGEKTRVFDYSMVLARPEQARLRGRWGSLTTLFDLTGDTGGWTLYLPHDRVFVRSEKEHESAGLLLPPLEILSVLLPVGIPPRDLDTRGTASRDGDTVRLVVPPGRGGAGSPFHRVLWLDARTATPKRLEIRHETQLEAPVLIAVYDAYEGSGVEAFATRVRVTLPEGGQWAEFTFSTVRINTGVEAGVFTATIPPGTRELSPEDLTPDFLPEAEVQ
jgi:hypothetical protein